MIGYQFGGPGERVNMVPMEWSSNQHGEWKQLEQEWKSHTDALDQVAVVILIDYPGDTTVPARFHGQYVVRSSTGEPDEIEPFDISNSLLGQKPRPKKAK